MANSNEIITANHEAIVKPEERVMLLDRRFLFYGDAERVVWSEIERTARLQLLKENV